MQASEQFSALTFCIPCTLYAHKQTHLNTDLLHLLISVLKILCNYKGQTFTAVARANFDNYAWVDLN